MKRWIALGVALAAVCGPATGGEIVSGLFDGETVVTGRDNLPERERGFREALRQVAVKATGDGRLADDPRLTSLTEDAAAYVVAFDYRDRMAGIPIHDEQGTRDRSYVLRVTFDPTKLGGALERLGARLWEAERPRVLAVVGVVDANGRYVVGASGDRGYAQREALRHVAGRRGVPLVLPAADEAAGLDPTTIDSGAASRLAADLGADAILVGALTMRPDGYWDTRWSFRRGETTETWRRDGTPFDVAMAEAIGQAAAILAELR